MDYLWDTSTKGAVADGDEVQIGVDAYKGDCEMNKRNVPERIWVHVDELPGLSEDYKWEGDIEYVLATALEAAQQQLVENEIRLRIAGDDIAKLRETIADYQSLLKEG